MDDGNTPLTHPISRRQPTQIWIKDIKAVPDFKDFTGALGDFEGGVDFFLNQFLAVNEHPQVRPCLCLCLCVSAVSVSASVRVSADSECGPRTALRFLTYYTQPHRDPTAGEDGLPPRDLRNGHQERGGGDERLQGHHPAGQPQGQRLHVMA